MSDSSYVKTTTVIPKRNAGDITIVADTVSLSGRSSLLSNTEPNIFETEFGLTGLDYGNAGRLEIKTGSLQLADQSKISSDSFTSGDGGDVALTATGLAWPIARPSTPERLPKGRVAGSPSTPEP